MNTENTKTNNMMLFLGIIIAGAMISGAIIYTNKNNNNTSVSNSNTVTAGSLEEKLSAQAKEIGLNQKKFDACLAKNDDSEIQQDIADAQKIGISGTPGFVVGKSTESGVIKGKIIAGAYPIATFDELINQVLNDQMTEGELVLAEDIKDPTATELGMSPTDFNALSDTDKADLFKKYKDYVANQQNTTAKIVEAAVNDDPVLGDENAPVTIIEYGDFECPFCQRHFKQTLPQLMKKYVNTGKVKIVYKDMIAVPSHNPVATTEAIAANCAKEIGGNDAYIKMHDFIYTNSKGNGQGL